MTLLIAIILWIICRKQIIGVWWILSIPAFPAGCIAAIYKDIKIKINPTYMIILFVIYFLLIWYGNKIFSIKIKPISIHIWLSVILFSLVMYSICSKLKSAYGILPKIGGMSGEIILAQSISLVFLKNKIIYIENRMIYLFGTIIAEIVIVIMLHPIYSMIKKEVNKKESHNDWRVN